jgi:tetratricopeptide (TPR) repeat protein
LNLPAERPSSKYWLPALALVAGVVVVAVAGFFALQGPTGSTLATRQQHAPSTSTSSDLVQAVDALRNMSTGGGDAGPRIVFYLNQWLTSAPPPATPWTPDPMVESIPRIVRMSPGLALLDSPEFAEQNLIELFEQIPKLRNDSAALQARLAAFHWDLSYLQQCLWLHEIAERTRREPPPERLAPWLAEFEKSAGVSEAEQLAAAERMFDWTVRNIQLDPLPPPPPGPAATVGQASTDPIPASMLGQLGPGYGHVPLMTLLEGHGDAWERARVFILLCRQSGVPAVMLGYLDEEVANTPIPWVPGVLIGSELYLFDTQLGLPLPGPGGKGIATLVQARDDAAILSQLDIEGGPKYPLNKDKLASIVALIDAEPGALSRRMQLLEGALPSGDRMALSIRPSLLDARLRKCKGVGSVSLWRVPLEANLYHVAWQARLYSEPQLAQDHQRQNALSNPSLMAGRTLHLAGEFETVEQKPGARTLYLQARPPDQEVDALQTSGRAREAMGISQQLPQDPAQRDAILAVHLAATRRAKQNATYWLGLTYFDVGKYEAAVEWLNERVLGAPLPSFWDAGARYNLGRCFEALGQPEKAIPLYEGSKSPQQHGNLLRAKWLKERAQATAESAAPAESGEPDASAPR